MERFNSVSQSRSLFDLLWDDPETKKGGKTELNRAIARWNDRPTHQSLNFSSRTLLAACAEQPEAFGSVLVAAYTEPLGPQARKVMKRFTDQAVSGTQKSGSSPSIQSDDFQNAWGYQYEQMIPPGSWLIDLNCKGNVPKVHGCSRVPTPSLRLKVLDEDDITITVRGVVEIPGSGGRLIISGQEKEWLKARAKRILQKSGDGPIPLPRVLSGEFGKFDLGA